MVGVGDDAFAMKVSWHSCLDQGRLMYLNQIKTSAGFLSVQCRTNLQNRDKISIAERLILIHGFGEWIIGVWAPQINMGVDVFYLRLATFKSRASQGRESTTARQHTASIHSALLLWEMC